MKFHGIDKNEEKLKIQNPGYFGPPRKSSL
jgi:hypothetical protein